MTRAFASLSDHRLRWLRGCQRRDPTGRWFLPLAATLLDAGFVDDARDVLGDGLERHPGAIGGWVLLGRCHLGAARLEDARRAFEKVVTLDPDNAIALRGLATISVRQGNDQCAAELYRALLRLMPWDLDAQKGLAEARNDSPSHLERTPSRLLLAPDLAEVRAAVFAGGRPTSLPPVSPPPPNGSDLATGHRRPHAPRGAPARRGGVPSAGRVAEIAEHLPAAALLTAAVQKPRPTMERPDEPSEPRRTPEPVVRRGTARSLHPAPRPATGLFESPPHDLDLGDDDRRRRGRPRSRRSRRTELDAPPQKLESFMRWVHAVSHEGPERDTDG